VLAGHSLTEAAYQGGFADAAHFSRTFRRMFGLPPSQLLLKQQIRSSLPANG
jgi:AraC-like DNA-binding protein